MTRVFHGTVQSDGRIEFDDGRGFSEHVRRMKGARVDITVEVHKSQRSNQQNRLLHTICRAAADDLGWEEDEFWELMKQKFLLTERDGRQFCRSTTTLTVSEMSELIEKVLRWVAIEFGFVFTTYQEQAEMTKALAGNPRRE